MNKRFFRENLGWGFLLWFIGYLLGILLFAFVPATILGWVIMPVGIFLTIWILNKKISLGSFQKDLCLAFTWTMIAIICDYVFLVQLFKPVDGYYKIDVYLYYILTFFLPLLIGKYKRMHQPS